MLTRLLFAAALLAAAPALAAPGGVDHALLGGLLKKHVHGDRVDYAALKGSADLEKYVAALAATDPDTLPDDKARLAFWLNAYNALTLRAVLEHFPKIKSVQDPYPDFGFFKRKVHEVGGKKYSLDDIEHAVIRPRFQEPRIHAALNCASVSCPPLAPFAFTAEQLEAQLEAQFRAFARDRSRNAVDAATGEVKLSQLFNWYAKDFEPTGGAAAFIARYLEPAEAEAVKKAAGQLAFLEYDWRLNGK